MKRLLALFICLLITGVVGCEQEATVEQAKPDLEKIKQQLLEEQYAYANAWSNKDMNHMINNVWAHDDDITIWGPAERDRVQGWEGPNGVKAWYQNSMDSMAEIDFKIHDVLIKVSQNGTAAVVTYYVENDFVDNDGNKGKLTPRVTVVKELRDDGTWKCIHGDASFSIAEVKAME